MRWALRGSAALAAIAIGALAGTAPAGADCLGDCTTTTAPTSLTLKNFTNVAPTAAEVSAANAYDAQTGTQITSSTAPIKCYNQQAWEGWTTHLGRHLYWINFTHWCGRAYVHVYKSLTYGHNDWQLPPTWQVDASEWRKNWCDATGRCIRTEADGRLAVHFNGLTGQRIHALLCLDVFANGAVKISCHN